MKMFVTIHDDADLLPHFLRYYVEQGYTQIIIGLSRAPGAVSYEEVEAHCAAARSREVTVAVARYGDGATLRNGEIDQQWTTQARAAACGPREWHGIADLDEHHVYPGGLISTLMKAEAMNADYMGGSLVDQVAADGSLPAVPRLPTSLPETFPESRRVTGAILLTTTSKICLVRGQVAVSGGQHQARGGKGFYDSIEVLHYKWHSGVLHRLRRRLDEYRQQGLPHAVESERILDYLSQHNGFDMEDPNLWF